jgi:kumamolisin
MTRLWCLQRTAAMLAALAVAALFGMPSRARAETYDPPRTALAGFVRSTPRHVDVAPSIDLVIELQPKDRQLDSLAATIADPASPVHRSYLTKEAFAARFGRSQADVNALATWLRAHNAADVYVSSSRLVVGGYLTLDDARKALGAHFDVYERGDRQIVAPVGPVTIPVSGIRAVHGLVAAYAPRLADVATLPNDFRGAWFPPVKFRQGYEAVPGGGEGMRIALIEDASDRFDLTDVGPFITGADAGLDMLFGAAGQAPTAPTSSFGEAFGAQASRIHESDVTSATPDEGCGRDDRGQEADMDTDAELTLAPMATIELRYDRVCVRGGEGLVALQRTLDANPAPDVIVFPFNVGPVRGPTAEGWGPTPIPYLEAAIRGIPVVVPAGDDGPLGYRTPGDDTSGLAYPCVLPVVICTGGTQLGLRSGTFDEGPWNDGLHAGGGGISWDPRPSWQTAPGAYEFSTSFPPANHRMVPDVAADASGHLEIFWHGYGLGGIGGTSESAAIVAAQIATINAVVPKNRRITSPGDLYALAMAHPEAFRHIVGDNDRGYFDNTLHPKPLPPPLGYHGVLPSPPPQVLGCHEVQPRGCDVRTGASAGGYNPVTGVGSLKEKAAIDALR